MVFPQFPFHLLKHLLPELVAPHAPAPAKDLECLFVHATDGNHNGHTTIAEQFELLQQHLPQPGRLLVSDRGTFSARHLARAHRDWPPFLPAPRFQGGLTVADLALAGSSEAHVEILRAWAGDVWAGWADRQETVRALTAARLDGATAR